MADRNSVQTDLSQASGWYAVPPEPILGLGVKAWLAWTRLRNGAEN